MNKQLHIFLFSLLIPVFGLAQNARKINLRLNSSYNSIRVEYDSVFHVYEQRSSELSGIRTKTSGLFLEVFSEKTNRLWEVKRKLWNHAADLRMVGLMHKYFPGFPSRRLDSLGFDYAKGKAELKDIDLMGDTNALRQKKEFSPISKGLSFESQNRILEKRVMEMRSEIDLVRAANDQMNDFIANYVKCNSLLDKWGVEIDEMITIIESTGAPVIAKWEEVNAAVQANPEAFDGEYKKVFKRRGEILPCGFAMEFFPDGTKVADLDLAALKTYVPAKFSGDCDAILAYLSAHLVMPESIKGKGLNKCFVRFVITEKGEISDVEVQKGVPDCAECDEEAVRVVKEMPKWKPGSNHGKPVKSYYYLAIKFESK